MATTSPASPPAPTPPEQDDWPTRATDMIVSNIGRIRDKTTGPARNVARWLVFGAFAISLGTVAMIILVIGAVRALDNYLPDAVFGETHTWAAHSILGAVLTAAGFLLYRFKVAPARRT